jgi:hypothetical protein
LVCATFGVYNGVETAFKRRNISIRNVITEISSKSAGLRFAICRDYFDAEVGLGYIRRVERSRKTVYTLRYLNPERNNIVFVEI